VKCNVPVAEAINDEAVLPERVQEALGQLVGAAKEGLLALSVEVGLGVLRQGKGALSGRGRLPLDCPPSECPRQPNARPSALWLLMLTKGNLRAAAGLHYIGSLVDDIHAALLC
jgi:hypothetical protein